MVMRWYGDQDEDLLGSSARLLFYPRQRYLEAHLPGKMDSDCFYPGQKKGVALEFTLRLKTAQNAS